MPILRLEFCSSCEAPHSNLANNFFASVCDNFRPIISFATLPLAQKFVASVKSPSPKLVLVT
jgi:hypothetical protein